MARRILRPGEKSAPHPVVAESAVRSNAITVMMVRNNTGAAIRPGQMVRIPPQETEAEREEREERERSRALRAAARDARAEREQAANDRYKLAINEIRARTGSPPTLEQMMRERFKAHGLIPDENQE